MSNQLPSQEGDFVRVATGSTPTEAHLLKGVLESNGIAAVVADANIVQANTWLTQAVGGVRVLVPAGQLREAERALAEFHAGAFQLPDEDAAPAPSQTPLAAPIFSPDRAALLSFALTPVFGAALLLVNSLSMGSHAARIRDAIWFVLMAALTVAAIVVAHRINPGTFVILRASLATSLITVLWYFAAVQQSSKDIVTAHGRHYPKRAVLKPAVATLVAEIMAGWAINEFA